VFDRDLIRPVDLLGAVNVSGQTGNVRYGVMAAFEDDTEFRVVDPDGQPRIIPQGGNNYGVARLLWESNEGGQYRALGFLTTAVDKEIPGDAYATGIDWHFYTRNAKLKLDGQAITSDVDGSGRGYGAFTDLQYAHRQGLTSRLGIEYFDDRIDINDLGFLERNNHWQIRASQQRTTSDITFARQNRFDIRGGLKVNLDGQMVQSGINLSDMVTLHSLHRVFVVAGYRPRQYDDLNSFGNGTYRVENSVSLAASFTSDNTKKVGFRLSTGTRGEATGGQSWNVGGSFSWRPNDRFNTSIKVNYFDRDGWLLHQQGGNMTTFQAQQFGPSFDVEYFLSAKQQFRMTLQWVGIKAREDQFYRIPESPGDLIEVPKPPGPTDDFSVSQLSFQARYRWEIAPLSDLFVVYTRLASESGTLFDEDFGELFKDGWENPIADLFTIKLRYRFGS
jgi:hypothetical protein